MTQLFDYYIKRDQSPTHAGLTTESALLVYDQLRQTMFQRLQLLPSFFAGRRLLEFGPDTGENALVFARWGARVTLVEPNLKAHATIRNYFKRFELETRLERLEPLDLLDFQCAERFDVVDAEGFIYTIQPQAEWMDKCAGCLVPGGLLIISYMERFGSFLELLLKAAYRRVIADASHPAGIDTARQLYLPKWNSIPHTRTIDSWFMDVIENPFVRLRYFLDPERLLPDMQAAGLHLHSSWPVYRDPLSVRWIKAPRRPAEELRESISFVQGRRLSHLLGIRAPMVSDTAADALASAVDIADQLCDGPSEALCTAGASHLATVLGEVHAEPAASAVLQMCQTLFRLIGADDAAALVEFCRTDQVFISAWGTPAHYAVFRYDPGLVG